MTLEPWAKAQAERLIAPLGDRWTHATWLVSEGVPVNVVQAVMGHEQASTTLNRYTHVPADTHAASEPP